MSEGFIPPVWVTVDQFAALGGIKRVKAYELLKRPDAPKRREFGPRTVRYSYEEAVVFWRKYGESMPTDQAPGRVFRCGKQVAGQRA